MRDPSLSTLSAYLTDKELRDLFLRSSDAIYITSADGRFLDANQEQGWTARSLGGNVNVASMLLESENGMTDIQVAGYEPTSDQASTALEEEVEQLTVQIQVHGPCVRTGGPDSDEVKALEQ